MRAATAEYAGTKALTPVAAPGNPCPRQWFPVRGNGAAHACVLTTVMLLDARCWVAARSLSRKVQVHDGVEMTEAMVDCGADGLVAALKISTEMRCARSARHDTHLKEARAARARVVLFCSCIFLPSKEI